MLLVQMFEKRLTQSIAIVDVVTSSVEELAAAMSDAEAVICATGFTPKPFSKNDTAHLVDNVGTCKLVRKKINSTSFAHPAKQSEDL